MPDIDVSSTSVFQPSIIHCFILDDDLYFAQDEAHETVDGYLLAHDTLVQRMLNEIRSKHSADELKTLDNINFYPIYNLSNHSIRLEGTYWFLRDEKENHADFLLSLSPEEQNTLMYTMELYCISHHSCNCMSMLNTIRTEDGLQPLFPKDRALFAPDRPGDAPSAEAFAAVSKIATNVRQELEAKYGEDLTGNCIEASEKIAAYLSFALGIAAKTVEGWCQFDDECYGSDRPWDPHTWAEIPSLNLYIDVTADQFNYGMAIKNEYPTVLVQQGLPHGMRYDEPTWREYSLEENEKLDLEDSKVLPVSKDDQPCKADSLTVLSQRELLQKQTSLNGKIDAAERERIASCSTSGQPSKHGELHR